MTSKDNPTLPIPVDFIDLTQDSPINLSRRDNKSAPNLSGSTRRLRAGLRNRLSVNDLNTGENVPTNPSVQVLDDIINLDDSLQNSHSLPSAASDTPKEKTLPTICPICLEELSSALKPMSTRCGHIYCSDCLQGTLKAKKKCPKCQSTISEKTCIRLYF